MIKKQHIQNLENMANAGTEILRDDNTEKYNQETLKEAQKHYIMICQTLIQHDISKSLDKILTKLDNLKVLVKE